VERCFNEKMDSHPDEVYKIMLDNQHKNRKYKKDPCHIKVSSIAFKHRYLYLLIWLHFYLMSLYI
jgi:hypothetical protein